MQSIRYTPLAPGSTLNASPPVPCWSTGEPTTPLPNTGGNNFYVWCSTRWTPISSSTRTVTLSACAASVSASTCVHHPVVQEVVTFDDYPVGVATPTEVACTTYCGTSMIVDSWVEHPTTPTVACLSSTLSPSLCTGQPVGGPITGGASIAITGTGFVSGSTVQFVEESGGSPTTDNVVLTAKGVTWKSANLITVVAPPVTEGSTYFVTVTTPAGTSAYSASDIFTYVRGARHGDEHMHRYGRDRTHGDSMQLKLFLDKRDRSGLGWQ